jgi:hypothetical protein
LSPIRPLPTPYSHCTALHCTALHCTAVSCIVMSGTRAVLGRKGNSCKYGGYSKAAPLWSAVQCSVVQCAQCSAVQCSAVCTVKMGPCCRYLAMKHPNCIYVKFKLLMSQSLSFIKCTIDLKWKYCNILCDFSSLHLKRKHSISQPFSWQTADE